MFGWKKITILILFTLFAMVPAAYDPGLAQRAIGAVLSGQFQLDRGKSMYSAVNNLNQLTNLGVVTPVPPVAGAYLSQYGYNYYNPSSYGYNYNYPSSNGYSNSYGSSYPNYNYNNNNYASSYPSSSYNYAGSSNPSSSYNYASSSYPNYNYGSYSYPSYNYASYGKK